MAEIQPLRAWRYNDKLGEDIASLTSPLFDVVSDKQRYALYENEFNSIHLSVPFGTGHHAAVNAGRTLQQWKRDKIILQDPLPGIYVYYQYFSLAGRKREFVRKGFICNIKAYDWDEKVILRHENTIPKAVDDRITLLEETALNVSPTHGLYTDDTFTLEQYMDESMRNPVYETEDYQGVKDVLSVIHDAKVIRIFMEALKNKQVILADGHHRYEGSLQYRKACIQQNPNHTGNEGYNFHLMFLTNTEADDLRILPTHRVIRNLDGFSQTALLEKLSAYFILKPLENPYDVNEIILGKKWAFGLLFRDDAYKIRLKPEVFSQMHWNFPEEIKELDLTVLHYFVIEKALGIPGKHQRASEHIHFERNFAECLAEVIKGEAQFALITKEISIEDVKKVCYSGYTLPQKSTYFYPKVICGFLFSSIKEDEFASLPHSCF